ncbi:hypothetical protein D3C78_1382330 [compost metagenome]
MAREGRHDEHGGLRRHGLQRFQVIGETLEAAQFAKRLVDVDTLHDVHADIADIHGLDAELRFFVVLAQAVEQLKSR